MVYDTLFGLGQDSRPRPQMAEGHEVSPDGRTVTIALRAELRFHDGAPVRAQDCIASIARWSRRDVLGARLAALLDELEADSRAEPTTVWLFQAMAEQLQRRRQEDPT